MKKFVAVRTVASGEAGNACRTDVSWLGASTPSGSIPAGGSTTVTISFDAGGAASPAKYKARLKILGDTPYGATEIPVVMDIKAPASHP